MMITVICVSVATLIGGILIGRGIERRKYDARKGNMLIGVGVLVILIMPFIVAFVLGFITGLVQIS